jgi:cytochrome c554/c'-like protein/multi-heme cytochrome with CxxCH motif
MATEPGGLQGKGFLVPALGVACLLVLAVTVSILPSPLRSPSHSSRNADCLSCHDAPAALTGGGDPGMVEQWRQSVHFRRGVGCEDCHGNDHEKILRERGEVSAGRCGTCHARQVREFANEGHAMAEAMAQSNARFLAQSPEMQRQGCMACHAIGKRFQDGSIGKCNACHLGHAFSAEQAREPEACITCHVGPDHPQNEAYEESKHGIAYRASRDSRQAPTCASCHMPGGTHDVTFGITLGGVAFGGTMEGAEHRLPMKVLSRRDFDRKREEMLRVCTGCHATSFAREALAGADAIKQQTDTLVDRAAGMVEAVWRSGSLEPRPENRPPNPVEGAVMVLGTHQLYEDTSPLEERFYEMSAFFGPTTWKGAYHHSPDHTHWLGNMKVKESLVYIEAEARRLGAGGSWGAQTRPAPGRPQSLPSQTRPAQTQTSAMAPFSRTFIPPSALGLPFKAGARYLGDRYCEGCHKEVYASWRRTEMAATFGALYPGADREAKVKSLGIDPDADFTHDRSCFPCHTTGYGQPGGFVSLEATPTRLGVQCEACHGPASEYMDHMKARKAGVKVPSPGLVVADERACVQCHHPSDPCPDPKYVFRFAEMKTKGLHEIHR